ncbi:MAG TPA: ABC transporter ATP-binding protein, partial [Actinomycetales bacterium]|nr:ABC transporter ATP-binding protein [Actinomycetales bacterium]
GKSTLLRLLNGLVLPSSGRVMMGGSDTVKAASAIRRRVGFVFTDPDAQLVMPTPLEDVALSLRKMGVPRSQRIARAEKILDDFGLAHQALVPVHQLSGGQKQLLALAGVLATEPALVVCDEPTTLLDLRHATQMSRRLMNLPQQLIYATHDLDFASAADRVLVIMDGAPAFDGEPALAIDFYRKAMSLEGSF